MKIDLKKFGDPTKNLQNSFVNQYPYPYIILDDFLDTEDAENLLLEHCAEDENKNWGAYVHVNEKKNAISKYNSMGPTTKKIIDYMSRKEFIFWLQQVTGIKNLISDPDLDGGGLHKIEKGGFLNIHVDFLAHTINKNWSRQLNLLLYLNKNWKDEWDGSLELWDKNMKNCVKKIEPVFNRCVIFKTQEFSYHGHPNPLNCPENIKRRSLALYYFRDEHKTVPLSPTNYKARPNEKKIKKFLIAADTSLLWLYALSKRYIGIKDSFINKFMKIFH